MKKSKFPAFLLPALVFVALLLGVFIGRLSAGTVFHLEKPNGGTYETGPDYMYKGKININVADVGVLSELPGIGEVLAQRIVDYREANGRFSQLQDLKNISGIGDTKLSAIMEYITVGGTE